MTKETLAKLYLELAHVVPEGTKTFRELELETEIERLRKEVSEATMKERTACAAVVRSCGGVSIDDYAAEIAAEAIEEQE